MTEQAEPKQKKRKDKVRSAWISFIGRIVAQILGAVATVALGLLAVHRYQSGSTTSAVAGEHNQLRPAREATAGVLSLAVLPLDNFSSTGNEMFANGLTEMLIADLSQIKGLRVISRTSSMQYRGERRSLPAIARDLGVDLIVEGSIVRADERVRVTAQLIDAKRDEHVWASSFHMVLRDELSGQTAAAQAIAAAISDAIAPRPREWRVWIHAFRDRAVGLLRRALREIGIRLDFPNLREMPVVMGAEE
jgi:TolB-like protein